jgi:hypothetical protein
MEQNWKEQFPRKNKPRFNDITAWLEPDIRNYFADLCKLMKEHYHFAALRTWTKDGWKYKFGTKGFWFFENITFDNHLFLVEKTVVKNRRTFDNAIAELRDIYDNRRDDFFKHLETKKKQAEHKPKKVYISTKGLNQCKWPEKVNKREIERLYYDNLKMIYDEELLDEVGYKIYTRCVEAKLIMEYLWKKQIKCMSCGNIINLNKIFTLEEFEDHKWKNVPFKCKCGNNYTFNGYRTSYRKNNMPRGNASKIFDDFIMEWEYNVGKNYHAKMRIIDNLIHEFHVSSITGTNGRFTGQNLIGGTKEEIIELINKLAYE